jgi:hypothetical protein
MRLAMQEAAETFKVCLDSPQQTGLAAPCAEATIRDDDELLKSPMIELIGDVDRALPERAIARWRAEARRCLRRRLQSPVVVR